MLDTDVRKAHGQDCVDRGYPLRIVSFDADFDRTTEGRLLPTDVL
jgi:hypothetical protein